MQRRVAALRVIEGVVIGAEARDAGGLVGQFLLQSRVLPRRKAIEMIRALRRGTG